MNIRKFVAATNRDALRMAREAFGADAVVLSNRVLEDGSVEITAMADSDLARITPSGTGRADASAVRGEADESPFASAHAHDDGDNDVALSANLGGTLPSAKRMPGRLAGAPGANAPVPSTAATSAGGHSASAAPTNAASHGLPDVYSSVFGASAEQQVPPRSTAAHGTADGRDKPRALPPSGEAAPATSAGRAANAVLNAARDELAAPGTLGEANQWLIEHALRVSRQGPTNATLTPSAAAEKGLGKPGELMPMPSPVARTSVPHASRGPASDAGGHSATARAHDMRGSHPPAHPHPAPGTRPAARAHAAQSAQSPQAASGAAAPTELAEDIQLRIAELVNQKVGVELAAMRGMMEEQFATLVWSDRQRARPVQIELSKRLFSAGFSAQLVRMVLDHLPETDGMTEALDWVHSTLETNIPVMENEDALMDEGGVFALMGPTGVGKTTTTAKLAARCVMRFGASKVALLTTDSYRIGAHEQLRIYGKILGVSVHAVKDAADLQLALTELRNKHIVLIDTIGMSQRERQLSDQIAMLTGASRPVKRLLLLNATSHGDTLNEVVQAYRHTPQGSHASPLAGCILTKLDEATNLGAVLDTVMRYKLPVHYVSTGQKVPENLYVATRRFLIKSAFCIPRDASPFVPQDEDLPVLLSALSARSTADLHEVHFG